MVDIYSHIPQHVYPQYVIPPRKISEDDKKILMHMDMPEMAAELMDFFFTAEDQKLLLSYDKGEVFSIDVMTDEYRIDAFQRAIINKTDETEQTYVLNSFYGFLDVFAVSQTERYRTLPKEKRVELDNWYFRSYMDSLDQNLQVRPTADKVLTCQEMLDALDELAESGHSFYQAPCDCKSLGGDCGAPDKTCISFLPGLNSFVTRGISQKISLEEAKEVIRLSEQEGVVHTISDHGICNCCSDCCYLFRGQRERKSQGFWPESPHIITMDADKCIACGKCVKRCRFHVFEKIGKGREAVIQMNTSTCVGCELCASTCPTGALKVIDR